MTGKCFWQNFKPRNQLKKLYIQYDMSCASKSMCACVCMCESKEKENGKKKNTDIAIPSG